MCREEASGGCALNPSIYTVGPRAAHALRLVLAPEFSPVLPDAGRGDVPHGDAGARMEHHRGSVAWCAHGAS